VAAYSPSVTGVPALSATIGVTNDGINVCETTSGATTLTLSGTLTTPPTTGSWGCAEGVASGKLTVDLALSGFPDPTVNATVVNVGGTLHLVLSSNAPLVFEGVANLVQDPFATSACASVGGSIGSAGWFGVMTFEDPVLPGP
jgi:hypothetical protein